MEKTWIVLGTRPEVIKQVPLFLVLREKEGPKRVVLVSSGQHTDLLSQALRQFDLLPDMALSPDKNFSGNLGETNGNILRSMSQAMERERPRSVIVQGDTATAAMTALAAFYNKIPVIHNEAGLRSYDLNHPFPEEGNRKFVSTIASLHLCPTELAKTALLKEGYEERKIAVVGNTGIDALRYVLERQPSREMGALIAEKSGTEKHLILLTAHRRENSEGMKHWFKAIGSFLTGHPELHMIYPVHPNNLARHAAGEFLKGCPNITICDPLSYVDTAHALRHSRFVVTDSGGIQEECATLGIPVVICRNTTERPEVLAWGIAKLCGTETDRVIAGMDWALHLEHKPEFPEDAPFGNGRSSEKIWQELKSRNLL